MSHEGLEKLLSIRKQFPYMVFGESQLQELTSSHFNSLVSQINTESRIQYTISHLKVTRGDQNSYKFKNKDRNIIQNMKNFKRLFKITNPLHKIENQKKS